MKTETHSLTKVNNTREKKKQMTEAPESDRLRESSYPAEFNFREWKRTTKMMLEYTYYMIKKHRAMQAEDTPITWSKSIVQCKQKTHN